jgi:3-polyprenyl-4-hydroxybenzoate decarboxylase
VIGYTTCLKPTKGPNCVIGVSGSDGQIYALTLVAGEIKDTDVPVYVVGTFTARAASTESGGLVYDGVINVRIIQHVQ